MLRVTMAFGGHSVGDEITDTAEIAAVLDSEQAHFVVAVSSPAEPAPSDSASKE
jgi:riboflavin synthase alpha subunit